MSHYYTMLLERFQRPPSQPQTVQPPVKPKEEERPLIVQVSEWLARLTDEQRGLGYPIDYFTKRFGTSVQVIGPVLAELGFRRERVYSKHEPHRRFWIPPTN